MSVVAQDLAGKKLGRWLVVARAGREGKYVFWECLCDCGKRKLVNSSNLLNGTSKSCGCLKLDKIRAQTKHGHTAGGVLTPEYKVWEDMHSRCSNTRREGAKNYVGRGIAVCDRWGSFENFFVDMGRRPSPDLTIERKNNDRGYEPGNCIWATRKTQARNSRKNHILEFHGYRRPVVVWSEIVGINQFTIHSRLARGWSVADALTAPVRA